MGNTKVSSSKVQMIPASEPGPIKLGVHPHNIHTKIEHYNSAIVLPLNSVLLHCKTGIQEMTLT